MFNILNSTKQPPFALMEDLYTLGIPSTSFMRQWNAFLTVLKKFPYMLSTCWRLFLHSVVQLIPNHLSLGWVIVEARSSGAALRLSSYWSYSPYITWRCVLGHCPVKKQMMILLSVNQMRWSICCRVLWLWLSEP